MAFCQHKNLQRLTGAHKIKKYRCLDCGNTITGGVSGCTVYEPFDDTYLKRKKDELSKKNRKMW